ncbi:MAG: hypothetical protein QX196_03800 [Methylococcaceae bacterium]
MQPLNRNSLKQGVNAAILLTTLSTSTAFAHIQAYQWGSFDGTPGATATGLGSTPGNYGWIDGTDADWADSHKVSGAFSFTLTSAASVLLSFEGKVAGGGRAGLNPGFSLYRGSAHDISDGGADHDYSTGSILIRNLDSNGALTEGSFRSLTSWRITNDGDEEGQDASVFTYVGHAYDGSQNYGTGIIPGGDGFLDNKVSKAFHLDPGTYTAFVGGSAYATQTSNTLRGISGSITVVPIPAPFALLLSGLGFIGLFGRKQKSNLG